jgi:hypothetical protein
VSVVYQHQLHAHKVRRRHPRRWAAVILVLLIGGGIYGWTLMKPNQQITNAAATTRKLSVENSTQNFKKGSFSIDLPKGWQFMGVQKDIYTIYHFRSAQEGEQGNRLLDVYEDSSLPNFAVNRMLPVAATENNGLNASAADVSDNCSAYTTGDTAGRKTIAERAKWQGIEFNCDMANPLRNVVGTGSRDGLNTIKVGTHSYFLAYTDANYKPDYGIFVAAINSFKLAQ